MPTAEGRNKGVQDVRTEWEVFSVSSSRRPCFSLLCVEQPASCQTDWHADAPLEAVPTEAVGTSQTPGTVRLSPYLMGWWCVTRRRCNHGWHTKSCFRGGLDVTADQWLRGARTDTLSSRWCALPTDVNSDTTRRSTRKSHQLSFNHMFAILSTVALGTSLAASFPCSRIFDVCSVQRV